MRSRHITDVVHETPIAAVRPHVEGDAAAIRTAFNRVFARVDPEFVPRGVDEWNWLYRANPAGNAIVVAVDGRGCVLAHYAALPRRAFVAGRAARFCQPIDSFAVHGAEDGLARRGAFTTVARRFEELYVGPGRFEFSYGLPVSSAWRIGQNALGYELLHEGLLLELDVRHAVERSAAVDESNAAISVEEVEVFPHDVGELFERVLHERARQDGADYRTAGARDLDYLQWRYGARPGHPYRIAIARDSRDGRRAVGCAVLRCARYAGREAGLVCELFTVSEAPTARTRLVAWMTDIARAHGLAKLLAFEAPGSREWNAAQEHGWRVVALGNPWAAHSVAARRGVRWFARHALLSLGDTDLV